MGKDNNMHHFRWRAGLAALLLTFVFATVLPPGSADAQFGATGPSVFEHIATFDVMAGNGSSVAEIVDVSPDGNQLVYTDAENEAIGFVNIADPANPVGSGTLAVGGEPTSLVVRDQLVFVAVNTSPSYTGPSGTLLAVDRASRAVAAQWDLDGQPDSIALSPNGKFLAIVIENERDEDLNGGLLPQAPSGTVLAMHLTTDKYDKWELEAVDLSEVADAAPGGGDLEPEFVDIATDNHAVVSFQENNYLAVINLASAKVMTHFSAGSVDLANVDTVEDDLITLDSFITRRREPDSVAWIDNRFFATANEGDYEDQFGIEGGARGFTIFDVDGSVAFESAESFEHALVSVGQYNEGRSENKGVEPEAVEFGTFDGQDLLFVGSERSNAIGVYDVGNPYAAQLLQILPTGMGPEGLKAIPNRGLLVASTESEEAGDGIPTMITIYQTTYGPSGYPMIVSGTDAQGLPTPWVALSGLAADPVDANRLYAVNDSFLAAGFIYKIDVSSAPAVITDRVEVTGASADLDLEGVAVGPSGTFWLGSEGNDSSRPNLVLEVDATGTVLREIELPAAMTDQRRGNGIEGIAVAGEPGAEIVYVALQRAWPNEGDIDGVNTKIGRYDVATDTWSFVHYPLQPEGAGGWIGLSELTPLPDGSFAVIERDKGWGPSTGPIAELKAVYRIELADADFRAYDDPAGLVTIDKSLLVDVLPALAEASIWTAEKLEGLAVAADGTMYVVTDNDGVDDAPGETVFLNLGSWLTAG